MKTGLNAGLIKLLNLKTENSFYLIKTRHLKNYLFSLLINIPPARNEISIITVRDIVIVCEIISIFKSIEYK